MLALLCFAVRMLLRPRGAGISRPTGRPGVGMLLILGILTGLVTADGAMAGPIVPGQDDLARGRNKYLAGEFVEALSNFESALVQDPENPVITLAVGETLFRLERYEEALAEFERTLSLTDDKDLKAEALYNAGTTLLAAGDPGKASEKLMGSLAMDESQGDALFNLEVALKRLQEQQQQEKQEQDEQDEQEKGDEEKEDQEKDEEGEKDGEEKQDQQDQDKKEQEPQEQQGQDQKEQEQPGQPEDPQEPTEPDPDELTQEQALQILKALDRDEAELKRSVQKRLKGGKPKSGKKW